MRRLIVGCGYLGMRVAQLWRAAGDEVYATTRGSRADALRAAGLLPLTVDVTAADPLAPLPDVDSVVFAVGVDRASGATPLDIHQRGLRAVLDALSAGSGPIVYVSTTGVYGHNHGEWVDEESRCDPDTDGGRACLAGERLLATHARGQHATVLRLAGLYGAGRVPLADRIEAGRFIPGSADAWLNLVHVDDASHAIVAAAAARRQGFRTLVVADGHPVQRRDYVRAVASLRSTHAPAFAGGPGLGKRVRNANAVRELALRLRYSTYAEGLNAERP